LEEPPPLARYRPCARCGTVSLWWAIASDRLPVDFGPDLGRRYCYPLMLEEMRALPQMFPSISHAGFYMAGVNWITDWLITPVIMGSLLLWPRRAVRPMAKLLWWG